MILMRIKKKTLTIDLVFVIFMVVFSVLNVAVNMDYISLIVYFAFLYFIYRTNSKILLKYLFMFVMFTYHIMSVFIVENSSVYFYNLQTQSYRSGAFIPLLLSYVLFFSVLVLMEENKNSKILMEDAENKWKTNTGFNINGFNLSDKMGVRIISFILFAAIVFMVFRLRNSFFYNMGGINRFVYRANTFSDLDEKFYTYIAWLLPIPLLGNDSKTKRRALAFFVVYCIYMIWIGDKFGSLFMAFYIFVLATWVKEGLNKKKIKKIIFTSCVVLGVLMVFISFQVLYERGSWSEVLTYFNNRLTGGQSDLWWKIYSSDSLNGWRIGDFFNDEVSAIFRTPDNIMEYDFGIYKMMKVTAPSGVVTNYLSNGARFAASTQASLFYYFKYTGLYLGSIILGMFCFILVNKAINAYKRMDIIRSICYTMLVSKWYQIMAMSDITMLGNTTTIIAVLILFAMYCHKRKRATVPIIKLESRQ